jgi:hypothetical protein
MKKLLFGILLFAGCKGNDHNGIYINHIAGQFAITDDTLIIQNDFIMSRSGFHKIRNGQALPKGYCVKQWPAGSPDAPKIRFAIGKLILINTEYTKIK